jgi:hypothetical protein
VVSFEPEDDGEPHQREARDQARGATGDDEVARRSSDAVESDGGAVPSVRSARRQSIKDHARLVRVLMVQRTMESGRMRNISFALTTAQVRNRTKTVTRRLGWLFLRAGHDLQPIEKGQGLKKGESPVKIGCPILAVDVHRERLSRLTDEPEYGAAEVKREGFPEMSPADFVAFFAASHQCPADAFVTRIEFTYDNAENVKENADLSGRHEC